MPLPASVMRGAIAPTIVTCSPSRIHTVPSPMTTLQWKRDHGSRSRRAGMFVLIVRGSRAVVLIADVSLELGRVRRTVDVDAALSRAGASLPLLERGRHHALELPARM